MKQRAVIALAGLAVFVVPSVGVPAQPRCVGGACDLCPAVAKAVAATGAQIYCIA